MRSPISVPGPMRESVSVSALDSMDPISLQDERWKHRRYRWVLQTSQLLVRGLYRRIVSRPHDVLEIQRPTMHTPGRRRDPSGNLSEVIHGLHQRPHERFIGGT